MHKFAISYFDQQTCVKSVRYYNVDFFRFTFEYSIIVYVAADSMFFSARYFLLNFSERTINHSSLFNVMLTRILGHVPFQFYNVQILYVKIVIRPF